MDQLNIIQRLAVWVLPVLFAITVHEVAHGWMAQRLGDRTALMLGRLTLNPIKHIDPLGTLLVPGLLLVLGGVIFGWAKPVPVTWENLRQPKRDMMFVAVAGPMANILMAGFWLAVMKAGLVSLDYSGTIGLPLVYMGAAGILINTVLMLLNLLPLPPLDGGRVVAGLLPDRLSYHYGRIEPYGLLIILTLLVTGMLGNILWPLISVFVDMLLYLGQVPSGLFWSILQGII